MQKYLIIFMGLLDPVIDNLNKGKNVLFDIDWHIDQN